MNGKWVWGRGLANPLLYRLPELSQALPGTEVFLVEGEKDVETLRALGLRPATTSGGSQSWRQEFAQHFMNLDVVLIPDNDAAGNNYVRDVHKSLADLPNSIRVLRLPGLQPGGDVSDWFASGRTVSEFRDCLAREAIWLTAFDMVPPYKGGGPYRIEF